ncbi:MAG: prolyl 4-hydroxylase, alpha subunit [Alphaproteobacteria bacterium]|jgi:tetratricopeptide (TPR) repeat protein|nr:prolyl 4-hydroxylase, alpha subunit [Alphaproteobacteria bacterium]
MSATSPPLDPAIDLPQAMERARAAREQGAWAEAERFYHAVLKLAPSHAEAWSELAAVLQARGAPDKAQAARKKAAEVAIAAAATTAASLLDTALEERAPAILRKALQNHPSLPAGHLALGELLRRMGDLGGALLAVQRCLELEPGNSRASKLVVALKGGSFPSDETTAVPAPVWVIDDFLPAALHQEVLQQALAHRAALQPSTTVQTTRENWRRSQVDRYPAFGERVLESICRMAETAIGRFALEPFDIVSRDMQFTAHNEGDYYKVHRDRQPGDMGHRRLTYVYYLHRQPRGFDGGGLRLFDTTRDGSSYFDQAWSKVLPRDNRLVLFPSHVWHEVEEVRCRSGLYEDSRFTLNGWLGVTPE